MTLEQADLAKISPPPFQSDAAYLAWAAAFNTVFRAFVAQLPVLNIMGNVEGQPDAVLDALAGQFGVDFYDPTLPAAQKAVLIRKSVQWKLKKGTPWMVQDVIMQVLPDAQILEWFEYGGTPYHFRLLSNQTLGPSDTAQIYALVAQTKNVRSWFDGIYAVTNLETDETVAVATYQQLYSFVPSPLPRVGVITQASGPMPGSPPVGVH